ncbi:hypothetical protein O3M35_011237 [Rhynocoris fuscipes]|uniref:Uncharacterized protein n=1 Tax=Rhynocoris fuscipes TaxID=488301 RepID=A0AAW1CUD0_9HEMI
MSILYLVIYLYSFIYYPDQLTIILTLFSNIAVSSEKQIELLTHKGDLVASIRHSLSHASALAFDSIHSVLYVSDTSERNVSIFRIHVTKDGKSGLLQPVVQSNVKFIEGLAYDAVSSTIFWSTGSEKTIMSARLDENKTELAVGSVLHKFSDELVYGIAVDSCRGKLYWTNCNVAKPSIERSDLNGNNREVVVSTRLFRPMAVTISQADRLMYWVEEKTGYLFSVERCALDGSNRQTIVLSENQQPLALAVSGSRLYWTDDMHTSVWSVMHSNPDLQMPMVETRLVKTYSERSTILGGVISAYQDSPLDENVCRNMIDLRTKVSLHFTIYSSISAVANLQPPKP